MKNCPFPNCRKHCEDRMFCCQRHWQTVSPDEKELLCCAFSSYTREEISHAELVSLQNEVLERITGFPSSSRARLRYVACCCGMTLLEANGQSGLVRLEGDDSGNIIVFANQAAPGHGREGAYARFRVHACPLAAAITAAITGASQNGKAQRHQKKAV